MYGEGMDDLYWRLLTETENKGKPYGPRGKVCVELRPVTFTITHPEYGLYTGKSRRLNYRFLAIETLLYIAGIGGPQHAELILAANPAMAFALNAETISFDGAYGPMLGESLVGIQSLLECDPFSRQAVASIWSPGTLQSLTLTGSKDVPCTCLLQFIGETDSKGDYMLSMNVYMRSNDLNWGVPYDVAAFCTIQCMVADALGVRLGVYNHFAGSLHYYEQGNSDGERPPILAPTDAEEWLSSDALQIPRGIGSVANASIEANALLDALTRHLQKGWQWHVFQSPASLSPWAHAWAAMIRFRHQKAKYVWEGEANVKQST